MEQGDVEVVPPTTGADPKANLSKNIKDKSDSSIVDKDSSSTTTPINDVEPTTTATASGGPVIESPSVDEPPPKHQLQTTWKFWYFENSKDRAWEDCLKEVSAFETVEDFWSIYNHIKSASDLRSGSSYFVFKDGIKPMWEDAGNRAGGRWLINFDKRQRQHLDGFWLEVLLCLIGEAFDEDGDDVCGAVVDIRMKQDKINIWTANCNNKDAILHIGRKIKDRLGLYNGAMSFESHEATSNKSGSMVKPMFVL